MMLFLDYIFVPGAIVACAISHFHCGHPGVACLTLAALAVRLWSRPWLVRLVIRSLLGLEP